MGPSSILGVPLLRSALISLLALGLPAPAPAQAPAPANLGTLPEELLIDGLDARLRPLTNFQIPDGSVLSRVTLLKLNRDATIVDYTLASNPPFQVQAIICEETIGRDKQTQVDATILGPTETADEFYDANLAFYPPNTIPPCMMAGMHASIQNGWVKHKDGKRDAYLTTSHDRAVRHMANWVQYLAEHRGDRGRAAQFLAVGLAHEADQLRALATGTDLETAMHHLALLEKIIPSSLFDLRLPLGADQSGQVRRFLRLRLQLREKLSSFADDSATLIQRDQTLLRELGSAQ
jgi:hypothetical protein